MDRNILKYFWGCGDDQIIQFALVRAHLNRKETEVLLGILDGCMTQEEVAEEMNLSVRKVQQLWYSGADKLLNIPWVRAYATALIYS